MKWPGRRYKYATVFNIATLYIIVGPDAGPLLSAEEDELLHVETRKQLIQFLGKLWMMIRLCSPKTNDTVLGICDDDGLLTVDVVKNWLQGLIDQESRPVSIAQCSSLHYTTLDDVSHRLR